MIKGVTVTPLKQIHDDRGAVFHMLRNDAPHFSDFGEIYFSVVNSGVTKGWKRYREMVMSMCCLQGSIKLVLMDEVSKTIQEILLGASEEDYKLVTVPPDVWMAFSCVSEAPAMLATCVSTLHSADEEENCPLENPPLVFEWK